MVMLMRARLGNKIHTVRANNNAKDNKRLSHSILRNMSKRRLEISRMYLR